MDDHDRDDPDDEEDTDRRQRPTAAQLRRHVRTVPGGIPILEPVEPAPEPDFEWPVTPDRRDAEVLRRAARDPDDPVRPAEISAIVHKLVAKMRNELSELLTQVPADIAGQVEKRVAVLERDFDPVRRIGRWAAGAALAAIVAVGGFLYQRGRDEQHVTDELARLGTLVEKLEKKLEQQTTTGTRP